MRIINSLPRLLLIFTLMLFLCTGLITTGCSNSTQVDLDLGRVIDSDQDSLQAIKIGAPAPDFFFKYPGKEPASLRSLKGNVVLINFWDTSCPPCVEEMPYLQQINDQWADKGLVLLPIDIGESASVVQDFLSTYKLSLPVIIDDKGQVTTVYHIRYTPTTILIDQTGIIQGIKIGAFVSKEEIEAGFEGLLP
jgi:thiol-disulfide isomerase/thioredoxin